MLLSLLLAGCVTYNVSREPIAAHLYQKCFVTTKDAFLHYDRCPDINAKLSYREKCLVIQAAGEENLPDSLEAYNKNPDYWDSKLYKRSFLRVWDEYKIYGFIPAGTTLSITKIANVSLGSTGRTWVMKATLLDGKFEQLEVELPNRFFHTGSNWYDPIVDSESVPNISQEYLVECNK